MPQAPGEWAGFLLAIWLIVNLLIVGVWDAYVLLVVGETHYSVSSYVYVWFRQFPILATCVGVLIGHLVWPPDQSRFR